VAVTPQPSTAPAATPPVAPADTTPATTPPPARNAGPDAPTVRERRRFVVSQATALAVRARAVTRGASAADLAAGDSAARAGEALARAGDVAGALEAVRHAQQQWAVAAGGVERFRAPAAAAAPTTPAPTARAEAERVVAAFADALRSRDLSRVRRVYPGITPQQAQEWGSFFMDAHQLDVRLSITSFEDRGGEVVAELNGALDWQSLRTGAAQSRAIAYRTMLRREPAGWRLVWVR
jgi:hypothetical protein